MKILIIIPSLTSGGAERVVSILCNQLIKKGYNIILITYSGNKDFYKVDSKIKRYKLKDLKSFNNKFFKAFIWNFYLILSIRKIIKNEEIDIILSHLNKLNVRVLFSNLFLKIPLIITEHTYLPSRKLGKTWKWLIKILYPLATKVVSVSKGINDYFTWINDNKKQVIYNPLSFSNNSNNGKIIKKENIVISVGRLRSFKRFDYLIECFYEISKNNPDWKLYILGEGPLKRDLISLRSSLGLDNKVVFTGEVKNVDDYLKKAKIFCLSSSVEGFPNVLLEAMSCDVSVVSTNCKTGPAEIINNYENGILVSVNDKSKMIHAIEVLIKNKELRENLAKTAQKNITTYSIENIIEIWIKLFKELVNN